MVVGKGSSSEKRKMASDTVLGMVGGGISAEDKPAVGRELPL